MTYPCTIYLRPHGHRDQIMIQNIDPDDEAWFAANSVKLSMEEDGGGGVIAYADIGLVDEDGEPDEVIVFSGAMGCIETLHKLRLECEERKAKEMR
jgi:hypothetical protein